MIYSFIHPGSGLGNQLFRIVAGKVLALDKGYEYSAIGRENFKGKSFMDIDFGKEVNMACHLEIPAGKLVPILSENGKVKLWEEKTPYYNPEFNFIEDNTIIDGEFQDERYFEHRIEEIDQWLKVEPLEMPDDLCVIGFRGGEFALFPDLFLTREYWDEAIEMMRKINPKMKFEVHTDDPELARKFFYFYTYWPTFVVIPNDIGINWRSMRYAKYAIVANSSFYILPRLLMQHSGPNDFPEVITIAPRYWDRYNIKKWERPYNYYKCFQYL